MASRAEVEAARKALERIAAAAGNDLRTLLARIEAGDTVGLERMLRVSFPQVLAEYQAASAALGESMMQVWAADLKADPIIVRGTPLAANRAAGLGRWALDTGGPAALGSLTDQLVKGSYRYTVQASSEASGLAWARVTSGAKTCAFCLMLASRGAVYHSAANAGDGHKYHGHCDCAVIAVRSNADLPDDYDLETLQATYRAGVAESESNTLRGVLSGIRKVTGSH